MFLAPPWAIDAQAINSAGDPFLAPGIHVRVLPSPLFGLPITPLLVYRIPLQPDRTDIAWVDGLGNPLALPIKLASGQFVIGRLPPATSARCSFVQLETSDASSLTCLAITDHLGGQVTVASSSTRPYQVAAGAIDRIYVTGPGTILGAQWVDSLGIVHAGAADEASLPLFDVWSLPVGRAGGYLGASVLVKRAMARVEAGAPPRVALYQDAKGDPATAAREVERIEILAGELFQKQLERLTSTGGPQLNVGRTMPISGSIKSGAKGTARSPLLGEVLQASLDPGMARWLGFGAVDAVTAHGKKSTEGTGMLAAGRGATAGVGYLIRGFWACERERLGPLAAEIPTSLEIKASELPERFAKIVGDYRDPDTGEVFPASKLFPANPPLSIHVPVIEMWAFACAAVTPTQPPGSVEVSGLEQGPWHATDPGSGPATDAWDLSFKARNLGRAASIALARKTTLGVHESINPRASTAPDSPAAKYRIPLVAGVPRAETATPKEPGAGVFADAAAPREGASYRIAQADWFGRWSAWTDFSVGPKERPEPPAPVVTLHHAPPPLPASGPPPAGPLAGTVTIRVAILDALPPGSAPITSLEVTIADPTPRSLKILAGTWSLAAAVSGVNSVNKVPAAPPLGAHEVEIVARGPALNATQKATVTITASWRDVDGRSSPLVTASREVFDPRPPPQLPARALQYTARPDPMGLARAEIPLGTSGASEIRIFYADEGGILKGLNRKIARLAAADPARAAAQSALAAIVAAAAKTPAERANVHDQHRATFDWSMFENLTGDGIAGGSPSFVHALSGSLQVLSFYRPITVSAANVPSDFATAPLYAYAVPNEPPPAQPLLSVAPRIVSGELRAELAIRVPRGAAPPARYRVRRSSVPVSDPLRMLVVREAALPPASTGAGPAPTHVVTDDATEITLVDDGSVSFQPTARLKPWYRYSWIVEVRADAPGGVAPVGEWSPPSNLVTALLVAPAAPAPVTGLAVTSASGGGATLTWTAGPLDGGNAGSFHFEIYGQSAGAAMKVLARLPVGVASPTLGRVGSQWSYHDASAPPASVGDKYLVIVIDPLGRSSANNPSTSLI